MSVVPRNFVVNEGNEIMTAIAYSNVDRVALRLGLALVTWSRRSRSRTRNDAVELDHQQRMFEAQCAYDQRSAAYARQLYLLGR